MTELRVEDLGFWGLGFRLSGVGLRAGLGLSGLNVFGV